ncbi:hypothetical protein SAMN04489835_1317 [Mycolicibacterium rutilum]|uniref:LPXTG-motif cell wall anchor domain-containing protein n=1 Tax=Mycolicibacterium rutilum TaxID=370526 RepID=A0A1H6J015_MYCRU|nr:hypothetical protein SAMN04489835_1317 [Mycolicibacterium rutilum]
MAALLVSLVSNAMPSVGAEPSVQSASATTSQTPAIPTPTKHSYDDTHSGQQPEGASPALYILGGALLGLMAIAVILLRAGKTERHHLTRSASASRSIVVNPRTTDTSR